jgi:predicted lipid-binding transport protein (Tim44 family)
MVALIIFAIVAVVILFQLYNVLGRKSGFQPGDKPVTAKGEDIDIAARTDKPAEALRLPNLDMLKTRDANFNELNFLEKAREAYEQIVLAFHKGELETVRDRLSDAVFGTFAKALAGREAPQESLSFVDQPKADIDHIDYKDDIAQIRVRFLSELVYETTEAPAQPNDGTVPVTKPEPPRVHKSYKRTAEYWTFQKQMKQPNNPWLLTDVKAAKP